MGWILVSSHQVVVPPKGQAQSGLIRMKHGPLVATTSSSDDDDDDDDDDEKKESLVYWLRYNAHTPLSRVVIEVLWESPLGGPRCDWPLEKNQRDSRNPMERGRLPVFFEQAFGMPLVMLCESR